jgi:hypothetical protein|tara:strand:- start:34 stop:189 length:156 start_codon:yes stop_codon:yes gene_type:complete
MSEETTRQSHKIKFERKTLKDQEAAISKQTLEILDFIAGKKKPSKPDGSAH